MTRTNTAAAAVVVLLLTHCVTWGQSKSRPAPSGAKPAEAKTAEAAPAGSQEVAGWPSPDDADETTRQTRTLRIVNADGGPASGAKVLVGDPTSPRVIFGGRQLASAETTAQYAGVADRWGQIRINKLPLALQGGYGDPTGPFAMPPLMILGQKDEVAFLPPGQNNSRVQLRPMARIIVPRRLPTGDPFSASTNAFSVLAWWNNGFAIPHQPNSLGYSQSGSVDRNWKFRPHFEVFQAVRFDATPAGSKDPSAAVLYVPPGEVRLTIIPTSQLPAFADTEVAISAPAPAGTMAEADLWHLQNLALYAGPSRIIAMDSGGTEVVSFDNCVHSVRLRARDLRQRLPEWDESSDESEAVFLVRQVELPGDEKVSIEPGSPQHESILRTSQLLRSQLPPVRMGRRGSDGGYRFDLLCPGTYQLRLASRTQLRSAAPGEYATIGKPVRIRATSKPPERNPFGVSHPRSIDTYDYAVAPEGDGWDDLLVIHPAPKPSPATDDPFGPSPAAQAASGDDLPFGEFENRAGSGSDTKGKRGPSLPSADRLLGKRLTRQAQLQELRLRIRILQEQLQAASELVDQLEAE